MQMELKAGLRLQSAVCTTEVVVVKPPSGPAELGCGGAPLQEVGAERAGTPSSDFAEGTLMGKRYVDEESGVELLCVKAGDGSLSIDGRALEIKGAKPLPASD
jgi:hypothetical protein